MAGSPRYKVFDETGEYVASVRTTRLATLLMAGMEDGSNVRDGHAKRDTIYVKSGAIVAGTEVEVEMEMDREEARLNAAQREKEAKAREAHRAFNG